MFPMDGSAAEARRVRLVGELVPPGGFSAAHAQDAQSHPHHRPYGIFGQQAAAAVAYASSHGGWPKAAGGEPPG